jgi:hypothetical protein
MKTFAFFLMLTMTGASFAQDYVDMDEPIEVDGQFTGKNASDRLKNMRAKLEQRNEMLVKRKIEQIRFKQEMELMKNMQRAMNQSLQSLDKIN